MVEWKDGTKVSDAYVDSNNNIVPAVYSGNTPLSAYNLNKMQQLIDVYRNNYITAKTVEGAGKIRKIFGNLSQKTSTQGKNICPTGFENWESGHYNTQGVKADNEYRIRLKKLIRVTPNTSYYVTTSDNTTKYYFIIRLYNSAGTFLNSLGGMNNKTTFTTTADVYYISLSIYGSDSSTESYSNYQTLFENETITPFICLNSETDKTYEEFTPNMPSPDYPAEIEVAGDNINLFDKTAVSANKGISYSNGTEYSNNTVFSTDYIDIKGIDNVCWNGVSGSNNSTWGALYDASKNYLSGVNVSTKKYEITNSNAKYIRLTFLSEYLDILKIEKGIKQTGYTEYGCGGVEYKTINKNLFDLEKYYKNCGTGNNCTRTLLENGIKIQFTANADAYIGQSVGENFALTATQREACVRVKPNTNYTISMSSAPKCYISYLDENYIGTKEYSKITSTNSNSTYTFTTNSKTKYIILRLGIMNNNYTEWSFTNIQIEEENSATSYMPNQSEENTLQLPQNEFLAKISDYEDYVDEDGKIYKVIKKIVLDGTENWGINSVNNTVNRFSITVSDINNNTNNANKIVTVCNYFKGVTHNDRNNIDNSIFSICNGSSRTLSINTSAFSAVNNFKSFLTEQYAAGTPVEIYYVLTEPYTTTCDFKNIVTQYAEKTNLICDTEVEAEFTRNDGIASVLNSIKIQEKNISDINANVDKIEKTRGHVYGIRRKITNNSNSAWERLFDSIGKVANATKNGGTVQNDFDSLAPWVDINSCNYDLETGKINAWFGDANFKFDGSNGDVYTHIPKTYWKIYQEDDYDYVLLADYARSGFMEVDGFFVGRYNGAVVDSVLHSYSGLVPTTGRTRSAFRTLANALGTNFSQLDWRYFVLQMLYLVEYANYNSQSMLGNGIQSRKYLKTLVAESDTNRVVVSSSSGYYVGQIIRIGTSDGETQVADARQITAIEDYNSGGVTGYALTFDGSAVNIAVDNFVCTMAQITGQCDSLGMKSGCLNNDGYHSVIYRGVENLFANIWQFVDGINIKDYVAYICKDHSQYADNVFADPYKALAYTNASSDGWAKTLGLDVDEPFFRFPTEVGGGSYNYMADYYYRNTGNRVARVGGNFYNGTSDGLWCWNFSGDSSYAAWNIGCRVLIDNQ